MSKRQPTCARASTAGWWSRAGPRVRGTRGLGAVLACLLYALSGCSASASSGGTTTGPSVPVQDTTRCPHGSGRTVTGLPQASLSCLTGAGTVEMSRLHGKPEIINIWASWCAPCRREMPMLQRAHERIGGKVLFLGVDVKDSRSHALTFLAQTGISYPQVSDPDGRFALGLRLLGVPNTLVVDGSGQLVDRVIGELSETALQKALAALGVT
jgi:cytochrome c biogenesis protein CcmG/thiol:disulfide interchange protein DsbE